MKTFKTVVQTVERNVMLENIGKNWDKKSFSYLFISKMFLLIQSQSHPNGEKKNNDQVLRFTGIAIMFSATMYGLILSDFDYRLYLSCMFVRIKPKNRVRVSPVSLPTDCSLFLLLCRATEKQCFSSICFVLKTHF